MGNRHVFSSSPQLVDDELARRVNAHNACALLNMFHSLVLPALALGLGESEPSNSSDATDSVDPFMLSQLAAAGVAVMQQQFLAMATHPDTATAFQALDLAVMVAVLQPGMF